MTFTTIEEPPISPYEFGMEESISESLGSVINNSSLSESCLDDLSNLHAKPLIMPYESLQKSFYLLSYLFLFIAFLHFILLYFLSEKSKDQKLNSEQLSLLNWKKCSQLSNMVVNLVLGGAGVYYQFDLPSDTSSCDRIGNFDDMAIFAIGQSAFQLWSLIIGFFIIQEHALMLLHHFFVICVAAMSFTFTNGFRYYNCFFYGVAEISSVPLAVMNIFKDHPSLTKEYPAVFSAIKLVFATAFLTVRLIMWMPKITDFLELAFNLKNSCPNALCTTYLLIYILSGLFLTSLQLFWVYKVIAGLIRMVPSKASEKPQKKKV